MSLDRVLSLQAAVKGFHVYKAIWEQKDSEVLACSHEANNPHDPFAIKPCQLDSGKVLSQKVTHLPMELSRIKKFILTEELKLRSSSAKHIMVALLSFKEVWKFHVIW